MGAAGLTVSVAETKVVSNPEIKPINQRFNPKGATQPTTTVTIQFHVFGLKPNFLSTPIL